MSNNYIISLTKFNELAAHIERAADRIYHFDKDGHRSKVIDETGYKNSNFPCHYHVETGLVVGFHKPTKQTKIGLVEKMNDGKLQAEWLLVKDDAAKTTYAAPSHTPAKNVKSFVNRMISKLSV